MDGLSSSYLAEGLSDAELDRLGGLATVERYGDGEVIMRQFDEDADLFVVLEGKVEICAANHDLIARLKPGGVFGEVALLDRRPRSATVVAASDATVARLSASAVRDLMASDQAVGYKLVANIARVLCERLRSANQQIEALLLASGMDLAD